MDMKISEEIQEKNVIPSDRAGEWLSWSLASENVGPQWRKQTQNKKTLMKKIMQKNLTTNRDLASIDLKENGIK